MLQYNKHEIIKKKNFLTNELVLFAAISYYDENLTHASILQKYFM